jgi:hypothetical protein
MSEEEATHAPGTIFSGRYQVRRELGRGGMGVVYLCRDLVVDERVALKLLVKRGSKVRPEDAWWFQEEARALAGLSHPAIVRARDFGALPDGTPFLVMDAVPGRSLHEWLYLGKIKLLGRQILDGLDRLVAPPVEQIVEQAAEDIRMRSEDAPEDEVVLQIGEDHALPCQPRASRRKRTIRCSLSGSGGGSDSLR